MSVCGVTLTAPSTITSATEVETATSWWFWSLLSPWLHESISTSLRPFLDVGGVVSSSVTSWTCGTRLVSTNGGKFMQFSSAWSQPTKATWLHSTLAGGMGSALSRSTTSGCRLRNLVKSHPAMTFHTTSLKLQWLILLYWAQLEFSQCGSAKVENFITTFEPIYCGFKPQVCEQSSIDVWKHLQHDSSTHWFIAL